MNIETLFNQILHMGATASIVILTVFLVRALMHRFPKKYAYLLWVIVGIRLICPFALSSSISLFNLKPLADSRNATEPYTLTHQQQTKPSDNTNYAMSAKTSIQTANDTEKNTDASQPDSSHKSAAVQNDSVSEQTRSNDSPAETKEAGKETTAGNRQTVFSQSLHFLSLLWLAGIVVFLFWNVYQTIRMKRQLAKAVHYRDHIYECDNIPSPFVMGLFRPRIYIPFRLSDTERDYILAHEQYHIRRKDYLIKAAAFFLVIVYWFHPLVWISYFCMVRDMEMSCDEYVLAASDIETRRNYSQSLLAFATNQRHFSMGLLSFGETGTHRRIKHILKFRNGGKWMGITAILLVAGAALVCLTNGRPSAKKTTTDHDARKTIGSWTIHNYETKLLMNRGRQIKDDTSSFDQLYEGNFVLATYRDGKKVDEIELKAENTDPIMHFPATIPLHVRDYDGDQAADDFAIGQPHGSEAMTYQFFTVEENGSILPFTVSEEPMDYIIAAKDQYSPSFQTAKDLISYSMYDLETKKTEKADFNLTKKIDLNKSPDTETALVRKINAAITTTMPDKVVSEIKHKPWKSTGTDTYSIGNTEDFDATLRLDFTFQQNALTYYTSKEYGFVDEMPKERITKNQALALVQKFARHFLERTLEKSELHVAQMTPPRYDNKDYLVVNDGQGGLYAVQLSHNMVVMFTQGEIVYAGEDEQKEQKNGNAKVAIAPSEIKQITSASLSYKSKTDRISINQTITDPFTLETMEKIFSEATYVRGGSACPFGDAILTLHLKSGREIQLTWACDDCRIFRINGVCYEYIDAFLSTSPDGLRGFFDKIPWKRQA